MKLSARLLAEKQFVESRLGKSVICERCRATLDTWANTCAADLSEPCPAFDAITALKKEFALAEAAR